MIPGVTYCTSSRGGRVLSGWGVVAVVAAIQQMVVGSAFAEVKFSRVTKDSVTTKAVPGELIAVSYTHLTLPTKA